MVEAARHCASSPHEVSHQDALRHAAEEIRTATTNASTPAMRARTITRLEVSFSHKTYVCFCHFCFTAYFIHQ
jgi:talin